MVVALFYVQSCRGVGHLHRVTALATALVTSNPTARAVIVSGGRSIPDIQSRVEINARMSFVQLEVLQAATGVQESWKLVDVHGAPMDKAIESRRRDHLLHLLRTELPTVVVIEMFPFTWLFSRCCSSTLYVSHRGTPLFLHPISIVVVRLILDWQQQKYFFLKTQNTI